MKIIVSNRSGIPIYEQIKDQVKEAIFSGELTEGEALPSIRHLAKDLQISVITTSRAYSDLEQEGFIVNVQGKGCYVLPQDKEMLRENTLRKIEGALLTAIVAAYAGGIDKKALYTMLDLLWEDYDKYE
ncbi:MAG: GntR family transcriptional regulator [Clostridiales bacterium]|jgi:GntR family transcriptional regulator|nr:GntR family transcriptional regulator [Clostridiales bacterium]